MFSLGLLCLTDTLLLTFTEEAHATAATTFRLPRISLRATTHFHAGVARCLFRAALLHASFSSRTVLARFYVCGLRTTPPLSNFYCYPVGCRWHCPIAATLAFNCLPVVAYGSVRLIHSVAYSFVTTATLFSTRGGSLLAFIYGLFRCLDVYTFARTTHWFGRTDIAGREERGYFSSWLRLFSPALPSPPPLPRRCLLFYAPERNDDTKRLRGAFMGETLV